MAAHPADTPVLALLHVACNRDDKPIDFGQAVWPPPKYPH
jgi:hypothetical protein